MKSKEEHLGTLEAKLKDWAVKLESVVKQADEAGDEAKVGYRLSIDELKLKFQEAQLKLDSVKHDGADKWDTLKADLEVVWEDLESALKRLSKSP